MLLKDTQTEKNGVCYVPNKIGTLTMASVKRRSEYLIAGDFKKNGLHYGIKNESFTDGEFVKVCLTNTANVLCPE